MKDELVVVANPELGHTLLVRLVESEQGLCPDAEACRDPAISKRGNAIEAALRSDPMQSELIDQLAYKFFGLDIVEDLGLSRPPLQVPVLAEQLVREAVEIGDLDAPGLSHSHLRGSNPRAH